MSQFFRQLIDLGEEQSSSSVAAAVEDLSKLSQVELLEYVKKQESKHAELRQEYEKLQSDSLSLRSEYDAYKKKVDGWQRQMKEARAADKKMIEELRAAGSSGKIDDVFMKTTQDTIQQLKESLREAQEEVQKAYKRQREAEEGRVAAELSKKMELEELGQKLEAMRERSKAANQKNSSTAASGDAQQAALVQQLRAQLEASERQRAALQRKIDRQENPADNTQSLSSPDRPNAPSSEVVQSLQDEVVQLQTQLAQAGMKESELIGKLQKAEEKLQRHVEDSQWDALEAGKKLAEAKTELDMLKTRIAQFESKMDAKEEEYLLNEKQARRAVRDLEDALTSEKERHAANVRDLQQQRLQIEQELQLEREKLAHNSELIGEAESVSRKTNEALESQRRHFEKIVNEKDCALQQLNSVRESLEIAIQESKEDLRRHADMLEDLRRELDQSSERVTELEHQMLISERCLLLREEEVQSREQERHRLRAQLRQEEDNATKVRSTMTHLETRVSEMEMEIRRKDNQLLDLQSTKQITASDLALTKAALAEAQKALQQQEAHIHELTARIQDQGIRNSDIMKFREDQSMHIRSLEQRNSDLESQLRHAKAVADTGESYSHTVGGSNSVVDILDGAVRSTPAAIKRQFVADAMATMRQHKFWALSLSNYRQLIVVAIALFLLLSLFGGFHTTRETSSLTDSETIQTLREKYGQSLVSSGMCREALVSAKEQIASMCACPPK